MYEDYRGAVIREGRIVTHEFLVAQEVGLQASVEGHDVIQYGGQGCHKGTPVKKKTFTIIRMSPQGTNLF